MSELVKKTTIHGLNYYITEETNNDIYMVEKVERILDSKNKGFSQKELEVSSIIEITNLLPSLLGFICFIVILIVSLLKKAPSPWYMISIYCLLAYLFGVVNRHTLFFFLNSFPILPLFGILFNFIVSIIPFFDKIFILFISYFVFHNILIGVVYIAGTILLSIIPHDSVEFNDKVVRFVYNRK